MLVRFDPFRELDRLTQQVLGTASGALAGVALDAYRRGDEVVVTVDLPGVDPASVELTVDDGVLTLVAERHAAVEEGAEVLVRERPVGRFTRRLFLGDSLDADRIHAHYDQGVLTVTIPVAEGARRRRVAIVRGDAPAAIEAPAPDSQSATTAA